MTAIERSFVVREPELAAFCVRGPDAAGWLQGQFTSDVLKLGIGACQYTLGVSQKGRIEIEAWLSRVEDDKFFVTLGTLHAPALARRLTRLVVMEDLEWDALGEGGYSVALADDADADALMTSMAAEGFSAWPDGRWHFLGAHAGLFVLGTDLPTALATFMLRDASDFESARVRLGVPKYGVDFDDQFLPQEAGLKSAVSFTKGCYVGQEPVVMLEHRGKPAKRIARGKIVSAQPPLGAAVVFEGQDVGVLTSGSARGDGAYDVIFNIKRKAYDALDALEIAGSPIADVSWVDVDRG